MRRRRATDVLPLSAICTETGCERATHDRKPYCSQHIDRMPFVTQILAHTRERNHIFVARDIVAFLRERGPGRVSRLPLAHSKVGRRALTQLVARGVVVVREVKGHKVVGLNDVTS